jgi:hypothetical protein
VKKLWFEKGTTGEILRDIRETATAPVKVTTEGLSYAVIRDLNRVHFSITLRGSSKCRRKQARILQRWFSRGVK